jgi:hypothetical protein
MLLKSLGQLEEACELLEAGFKYVYDNDKGKIFKKPK